MANSTSASWPARWPGYLPLPSPIPRSRGQVPNQQSVDWPQAQFAPLYLPPGSPSFQPYRYGQRVVQPPYTTIVPPALGPVSANTYRGGPDGDIAKLPSGGFMSNLAGLMFGSSRSDARTRYAASVRARAAAASRDHSKGWGWRQAAPTATAAYPAVVRMGPRPTNQLIPSGIPQDNVFVPPEPIATAGLIPLYSGLAYQNGGCVGCGDFGDGMGFFDTEDGETNWWAVAGTVLTVGAVFIVATKGSNESFLDAAKARAFSLSGGALGNPKRRKRRKSKSRK